MARENGGFVLVSSGLEDSTQQYGIWQGYLAEDGSLLSEQWYHQHPSAILQGALLDTDQRLTLLANVGQEARLFQLDQQGTLLWEQKLQGLVRDLTATRKGGFALTGFHSPNGGPNTDAFITAVDAKGELIWNQSFGGNDTDLSESILQAEDGGFVIVGAKRSQSIGLRDFWILKVNENGLN